MKSTVHKYRQLIWSCLAPYSNCDPAGSNAAIIDSTAEHVLPTPAAEVMAAMPANNADSEVVTMTTNWITSRSLEKKSR